MIKTQIQTIQKAHFILFCIVISTLSLTLIGSLISPTPLFAQSQGSTLGSIRLESKLIESSVKTIGGTLIEDKPDIPYTIVEATYIVRVRAFGGDVYLPTYREDVVFSPYMIEPKEGSNAIVATQPSIELSRELPQIKGKFLLHQYEEVDLKIKTSFKIIPKSMPSRLVFSPRLDSLLWYPVRYVNGEAQVSNDPEITARLAEIPLAGNSYIVQEVSHLDFKTDPVVLIKSNNTYATIKENVRFQGFANIIGIFRSIFSK